MLVSNRVIAQMRSPARVRTSSPIFAKLYQGGRVHPWADRLNAIQKYVFSSTLDSADLRTAALSRLPPIRPAQ
jgi:hypothetical protein